jgi:hypothetical protein
MVQAEIMTRSELEAEVRRLGASQIADAIADHGVAIIHESEVEVSRLRTIFEGRRRRADARGDQKVLRLVQTLLGAFCEPELMNIGLISIRTGDFRAMLYTNKENGEVIAVVPLVGER